MEYVSITDSLLSAVDRREPWSAADMVCWLEEHYPDFLRTTEREPVDETSLRLTVDVFQDGLRSFELTLSPSKPSSQTTHGLLSAQGTSAACSPRMKSTRP
ncbi:hypothetical protein [Rhizobium esperanzae]|uniref:hypothetical protein n=1 Tax=Rhizobium esperanzae TaxID=1967781 RepID=UPI0011314762|nr:hypothetical protein [Rhizobium esperanzae]